MQLSPVPTNGLMNGVLANPNRNGLPAFNVGNQPGSAKRNHVPAQQGGNAVQMSTEYYSSQKFELNYTNADGDSVSISMEQVEYQRAQMSASSNQASPEWNKIVDNIKDEFQKLQEKMIQKFMAGVNGDTNSEEVEQSPEANELPGLPEYWNADNTSQRILDFAVGFLGGFEGSGSEFYDMIKGAIEDGFSQAKDMMGEMPDAVSKLTDDTYNLVMEKLDAWAVGQGIEIEGVQEQAAA